MDTKLNEEYINSNYDDFCNQIKQIVKFGTAKQIMDISQYLYKYTYDCDGVPLLYELTLRIDRNNILNGLLELNFNVEKFNVFHCEGNSCHHHLCINWPEARQIVFCNIYKSKI
jgi:hypothetical protein